MPNGKEKGPESEWTIETKTVRRGIPKKLIPLTKFRMLLINILDWRKYPLWDDKRSILFGPLSRLLRVYGGRRGIVRSEVVKTAMAVLRQRVTVRGYLPPGISMRGRAVVVPDPTKNLHPVLEFLKYVINTYMAGAVSKPWSRQKPWSRPGYGRRF